MTHSSKIKCYSNSAMLGESWPGIQLYYPPVKYSPALGIYEDLTQAAARMRKHAHNTQAVSYTHLTLPTKNTV